MHIMSKFPLFSVFDTETTGLTAHQKAGLNKQPEIIEFAGIITDGVEILDTIEFICRPTVAIDSVRTGLTGLTNADLREKPKFEEKLADVAGFFSKSDIAVAHNMSFDRNMLLYDLMRIGKTLDDIRFPKTLCCTVEQTMTLFGRRMKLNQLYNIFCGEYEQKHRALDDLLLLHEICKKLGIYDAYQGAK